LEMLGYGVQCVANGEDALQAYQAHGSSIDLVLLDLNMPGMGGNKCLKELLRIDPEVKVVIASGYTANNQGKHALSAGARGFIGKPYLFKDLAAGVRKALDNIE
jgi:DNA-binding NarL/FixJ family response regulator